MKQKKKKEHEGPELKSNINHKWEIIFSPSKTE